MLLAVVVVTAAAAVAASTVKVGRQALERTGDTRVERELLPAAQALLDPRPFVVAEEVIPPGDTFAVVAVPGNGILPIASDGAPVFAAYLLLPRRRLLEARDATWVIAYGVDPRALGLPHRVLRRIPPFGLIARR